MCLGAEVLLTIVSVTEHGDVDGDIITKGNVLDGCY
jgi:hypothetical protein